MTSVALFKLEPTRDSIADDVIKTLDELKVRNTFEDKQIDEPKLTNIWKRSPSYTNSYDEEWCRLFDTDFLSLNNLRNMGLLGELRNCRFRSVCWRIYLGLLSEKNESWKVEVLNERNLYEQLRNKYIIDPHQKGNFKDDPLSIKDESQWNKYFRSQDVMKEIQQDVVRTFPDIEFFRSTSVRTSMINVLYCYSQTSRLSYRQGMHEILAPLIFVLHCDHMAYEHSCEMSHLSESTRSIGGTLLDSAYLEHDSHSMFTRLMQIIEPWYDSMPNDLNYRENKPYITRRSLSTSQRPTFDDPRPFSRPKESTPSCTIIQRLSIIHDKVLKRQDLELYLHLERLEISPQMFGLRWLRLLFGREYTMQDLLMVWDVVFAVNDQFSLVDHIYVSMLVNIRDFLLASDFTTCLTHLMRYPPNVNVNRIVDLALHLFNPDQYEKPSDVPHFQGIPSHSLGAKDRRKRAQRNKTIVGIETLANRIGSFIIKKPVAIEQSRPSMLKYRQIITSVSDSAPVTPTNKCEDDRHKLQPSLLPVDTGDYREINMSTDQHQIVRLCVSMLDESVSLIESENISGAVANIKQARDILSGNLTFNRRTLVSELQHIATRPSHLKQSNSIPVSSTTTAGLNRSVSNNDISLLINSHAAREKGSHSNGFDMSQEILMKLIPNYVPPVKTMELKDISRRKDAFQQVTIDGSVHF